MHASHDPDRYRDAAPCHQSGMAQLQPGIQHRAGLRHTLQSFMSRCSRIASATVVSVRLQSDHRAAIAFGASDQLSLGPLPPSLVISEVESCVAGSRPPAPLLSQPLSQPLPSSTPPPRSPRAAELGPMLEAHARWLVGLLEGRRRIRAHHRSASAAAECGRQLPADVERPLRTPQRSSEGSRGGLERRARLPANGVGRQRRCLCLRMSHQHCEGHPRAPQPKVLFWRSDREWGD